MDIFEKITRAFRNNEKGVLATIVGTSGSTPAPAQSRMFVPLNKSVRPTGTVGGGCLDESIVLAARESGSTSRVRILEFELNDDIGDTGLACGGTVTIMLEPLTAFSKEVSDGIVKARESGQDCIVLTAVSSHLPFRKTLLSRGLEVLAGDKPDEQVLAKARELFSDLESKRTKQITVGDEEYVIELVHAKPPLTIFGGGHVGKAICHCASFAGFRVTLVDDRKDFARKERFPEASAVLCESFDAAFTRLNITPSTSIVIVTRGHRHDERVLEQALRFDCAYVGMIGSERKVAVTFERLADRGVTREQLSKVHAPIGVRIGAKTPEEIAISVIAELIAAKRAQAVAKRF